MSTDLDKFKQNRINEITNKADVTISNLYSSLLSNIRFINSSRIINKNNLITFLINSYNKNVANLRINVNKAIAQINAFKPEFVNNTVVKNKNALLIGINYLNTEYQLNGCIDDAIRVKELLTSFGFNNFNILTDLTDIKPTKTNILKEFENMLKNAKAGDILFVHYSGHGSYTYDTNRDERDGFDEMLVSLDLKAVLDDELKTIIKNNLKKDVTLVGLFDSCHSGTILDLKYCYMDSNNYDNYSENDKASECDGNVIMISGCMDKQTSAETVINNKVQGALSWSFIDCLTNNKNCSWRVLLKNMRENLKNNGFSQIPQLSTDSFYDIDNTVFIC